MLFVCDICNQEVKYRGVSSHLRKHKIKLNEYLNTDERMKHYKILKEAEMDNILASSPFCKEFYLKKGIINENLYTDLIKKRKANQNQLKETLGDEYTTFITNKNKILGEKCKASQIQNIINNNNCDYTEAYEIYCEKRRVVSPRTIDYWINKGYSEDEAKLKVSSWQSLVSPRTIDYWINKGYSEDEAKLKVSEYQDNFSDKALQARGFSDEDIVEYRIMIIDKIFNTKLAQLNISYDEFLEYKEDKQNYYKLVWFFTKKSIRNYGHKIIDLENRSMTHHLDHKFSIIEGYKNKVSPELIGSIHNLEMLPHIENINKRDKCSITLDELIELNERNDK